MLARAAAFSPSTPRESVVVEHVAIVKKHTRPKSAKEHQGRHHREGASIHVSNVMVICASCGKADTHRPHHSLGRHQNAQFASTAAKRSISNKILEKFQKEIGRTLVLPRRESQ